MTAARRQTILSIVLVVFKEDPAKSLDDPGVCFKEKGRTDISVVAPQS
jgi:hypothetical protein